MPLFASKKRERGGKEKTMVFFVVQRDVPQRKGEEGRGITNTFRWRKGRGGGGI